MSVDVASFDVAGTVANGPISMIPPGTGLGESFLTWDGSQYVARFQKVATQIATRKDERQIRLLRYLLWFRTRVVARVCSGIGIPNTYEFCEVKKEFRSGLRLLRRLHPRRITRKRLWRVLSIRSNLANYVWRRCYIWTAQPGQAQEPRRRQACLVRRRDIEKRMKRRSEWQPIPNRR